MCSVDFNAKLARSLRKKIGNDSVYLSSVRFGWGAGLCSMLLESIQFFEQRFQFSHFLSIDTDTLFIARGADSKILNFVSSHNIGMIGKHLIATKWKQRYSTFKGEVKKIFGKIPPQYIPGEGVQGGCMLITDSFISEMRKREFFKPPVIEIHRYIPIPDDHLLPLMCRVCNLEIVNAFPTIHAQWRATIDPRSLDSTVSCVFHPTKLRPRSSKEIKKKIRKFFREKRQ